MANIFAPEVQSKNFVTKVRLQYQGRYPSALVECEVYRNPETGVLMVMTTCPKCGPVNKTALRIPGERKKIELNERGLFVEPWKCTWEANNKAKKTRSISLNVCGGSFEFAGRVIRDA